MLQSLIERTRSRRSDDRPGETLFFVHIPKSAGSSFRQVLKRWFGKDTLFVDTHEAQELQRAVGRIGRPPRAIAGHLPFGLHEGLGLRPCYVSLVRHPLDRFVSIYRHARRTSGHPMHGPASEMDLEAFYDFTLRDERARRRTIATQCYFLSRTRSFEETRAVIDRSYALLAPTERYEPFVEACAERFGQRAEIPPPRNVSPEGPISEETRARFEGRIEADHAEDLRLHRYVSETFDARRGALSFALHA